LVQLGSSHTIFFEKLAYMFERIGDRLPGYGEYCDRVLKRWSKIPTTEEQKTALDNRCQRLVKALTYVYADIIQFCQEACRIFSTSKKGRAYVL
jgi:hypothetical protein